MHAKLVKRGVEKPWGRDDLPPPFAGIFDGRIGEVWFEPTPALDQLLVKYIFTSEALSVQVHPSDRQTLSAGTGRQGKEECWLVIDAEPGAVLGAGLVREASAEELTAAALDGSIAQMIIWHPVKPGDFFYIEAGTIHAIGAGVCLIEVQQNSDITYRLFDYGRPRELHLAEGMAVARTVPSPASLSRTVDLDVPAVLVDGPLFKLDLVRGLPAPQTLARFEGAPVLLIPRSGNVTCCGMKLVAGDCGVLSQLDQLEAGSDSTYLVAQPCAADTASA